MKKNNKKVKFSGTIRDGGSAYVVTIPRSYIDNEIIELGKKYWFKIEDFLPESENLPQKTPKISKNQEVF